MSYDQEIAIENRFAPHYDSIYRSLLCYEERWKTDLKHLQTLTPSNHAAVCDVGCGTGTFLSMMEDLGFRNLVGVDISEGMIAEARKKTTHAEFHLSPMEKIGLASDHFDLITVWGALHHVKEKSVALRSLYRILKPGGVLYIAEPNHDWLFEQMDLKKKLLLALLYLPFKLKNRKKIRCWALDPQSQEHYTPDHVHIPLETLKKEIEGVGFTLESVFTKEVLVPLVEGVLFTGNRLDHGMFRLVQGLDRLFFKRDEGKGLQLILVARKPTSSTRF